MWTIEAIEYTHVWIGFWYSVRTMSEKVKKAAMREEFVVTMETKMDGQMKMRRVPNWADVAWQEMGLSYGETRRTCGLYSSLVFSILLFCFETIPAKTWNALFHIWIYYNCPSLYNCCTQLSIYLHSIMTENILVFKMIMSCYISFFL